MTDRPARARETRDRQNASLESDLLRCAREIPAYLFGKPQGEREGANNRQRTYQAISRGSIPTFRLGDTRSEKRHPASHRGARAGGERVG